MDDQPTADDLRGVPLLTGLAPAVLAALADRFDVEEFAAGRSIVTEGQVGYAFYVIASGKVRVTREGAELRALGVGDFFGEIAILGEGRRTVRSSGTASSAELQGVSSVLIWPVALLTVPGEDIGTITDAGMAYLGYAPGKVSIPLTLPTNQAGAGTGMVPMQVFLGA